MAKCRHCSRTAVEVGMCHRCYQYMRYWMKRGVRAAVKHSENVDRYSSLLDATLMRKKVSRLKRRKG